MANQRQDFLLDQNGDFPLEDNVINGVYIPTRYGNSDEQHKIDCILYSKGSLKQYPISGFGIAQYEESEYDSDKVWSSLSKEMEDDSYKLKNGSVYPNGNGFAINTKLIKNNY